MDPKTVEAIVAPLFTLTGLSHVLQPRLWVRFFERVEATGIGSLIIPMYSLPLGLFLIATHNIWTWDWPVAITIAGWGLTLKSSLYFLVPSAADRMLNTQMAKSSLSFQVAGGVMAILGAIITWQAWA
jgi:uncharacterized protein YjeT (DUF2065 family)